MTDREPAISLKVSEITTAVSKHMDGFRMLKNNVCKKNIFKHLICHGTTPSVRSLREKRAEQNGVKNNFVLPAVTQTQVVAALHK